MYPLENREEKRAKSQRLEARITAEQKEILKLAATLEGRSVTDFVVQKATEAARQIIEEHTIFKLSREDSIAFVESLLNPSPLADDAPLARAIDRYQQSIGQK